MVIYVESHADMSRYTADIGGDGELDVSEGTSVGDVLNLLEVPPDKAIIVLVNGRSRQRGHALQAGDKMVFFPPLEGG
jgi:molybdopterin converting factor small subunit